ncbi:stage II sporulation protein M [uncultured Arcticibacterium sp.]|uniref:stage II sporulation protein M n=1 Tax=uncultured Arcticibacterium sp. TaxID=2173042 RepID=UPI0030FB7EF2
MRESSFIHKYKHRWDEIETSEELEIENKANNFIDLANDLAYAKTNYPHSKLTSYLNKLTIRIYKSIFFEPKRSENALLNFWTDDLPVIIGMNIKALYISCCFFFIFCSLGYICSSLEPDFVIGVMGSEYVEMTENNILSGKPFGVYNQENASRMFLKILSNNLFVGLLLYTSGFFFGIGSVYHMFGNGVMIGSFFSIFFENNLGTDAFFVILLHGIFELMGLILEGMAGLILGLSIIFPGVLSRKKAFIKGLKESALIFLGTVPFTIIAAAIESYVTRFGEGGFISLGLFPMLLLGLVFLSSSIFVVWYFFIFSKNKSVVWSYSKYLRVFHA